MAAAAPLSPVKTLKLRDLFDTQLECEEALSDSLGSGLTPDTPVDWLEPSVSGVDWLESGAWAQSTPQVSQRPIDIALGSVYIDYPPVPSKVNWRLMAALLKSYGKPGGLLGVDTVPKGFILERMNPFQDLVKQIACHSDSLDQTPTNLIYLREAIRGFISAADLTKPMEPLIKGWTPLGYVLDWVSTESQSLIKILLNEETITKIPDCCTVPVQIFFAGIYSTLIDKDRKGALLTEAGKAIHGGLPFPQTLINIMSLYAFGFEAVAQYLGHMVKDPAWNIRYRASGKSEADKGPTPKYPNFVPNVFTVTELCHEADQNRAKDIAQIESKTAADMPALQRKLLQHVFRCDQEGEAITKDAWSIHSSITPLDYIGVARFKGRPHFKKCSKRFNQCSAQISEILPALRQEFPSIDASQFAVESFTLKPYKYGVFYQKLANFEQRVCELEDVQKRLQDIIAINQRLKLLAAAPTGESENKKQKESKEKEEGKRAPTAPQGALTFVAPGSGTGAGAPTPALAAARPVAASGHAPIPAPEVEVPTPAPAAAAAAPRGM